MRKGRILEVFALGKPTWNSSEYMGFLEALRKVMRSQSWDPTYPRIPGRKADAWSWSEDFHASVAEEISPEDYDRVSFFCAIGTPVDYFHGIDAFMVWTDGNGRRRLATIDISLREKSPLEIKADIFILWNLQWTRKKGVNELSLYASKVVSHLKSEKAKII